MNTWQVVNRRDKGKRIVPSAQPKPIDKSSQRGFWNNGNKFSVLSLPTRTVDLDPQEDLVEAYTPSAEIGVRMSCQTPNVPTCSRTGLIPCIYELEANDLLEDCPRTPLDGGSL